MKIQVSSKTEFDLPVPSYWEWKGAPEVSCFKVVSESNYLNVRKSEISMDGIHTVNILIESGNYVQCAPEVFYTQLAARLAAITEMSGIELLHLIDNTSNPES
jgi:hypothetical protein